MGWALLSKLPEADREAVLAAARRRRFARNEALFHEGDAADSLHLIADGHVAIRVTTPLGDVATLRVAGPGDHVGELALVSPAARNATVVALDAVETLSLHRSEFDDLRRRHPETDGMLLDLAIGEVRRLSTQLLEAMYVPVTTRVVRRLLDLVELYEDGEDPTTVPVTQDDLAGLAGTTRKTVNEVLGEAQDAGAIRLARGRVEVLDVAALRELGR
jgi:CRP-like cAMP-binding protein